MSAGDDGGVTIVEGAEGGAGGATLVDGAGAAAAPAAGADPLIGAKVSGCTIERKLGQGGMGSVYLARREADGVAVVLKFLAAEQAMNPSWRGRFLREAQMMQTIQHPNIVGIFSVDGESKTPHIVMELVDGQGLDALLEAGPLEPREAARVCRDIAIGLAEAHKAAIVHRDIKPANVLLTKQGQVKILDFGLARSVESDDSLSLPGQALGTPHYMAPEQWGDHAVDARADIYALGVTLHVLVTGRVPFDGSSPQEIQQKVRAGDFVRARQLVPSLAEDLELVILQAMCPDRRFRYAAAADMALDLTRFLEGKPVEVPCLIERASKKRYPLLPAAAFTLGREATCDIPVNDRSVSRQHARITREPTGFVVVDLGSSYGTSVGGMRLTREMLLKDGDEVLLGKAAFVFSDGGKGARVATTRRMAQKLKVDDLKVRNLPVPFVQALADMADRRVVVALLEDLASDANAEQLQATHEMLQPILGGDLAEVVRGKLEARRRRIRLKAPQYLFTTTKENLGDDVDAWLAWWDQARASYPPQVAPLGQSATTAQLRIVKGEPEERVVQLGDRPLTTIGRDEACDVSIVSGSVSRVHSTIIHLNRRHLIRDEGSRFGTLVNGQKTTLGFLRPGDRIVLGAIELVYEVPDPDLGATDLTESTFSVDPEAFFLLVEMKHKSVVAGLIRFLELESERWIDDASAQVFASDPKRAAQLAERVRALYAKQTAQAQGLLTELLGPAGQTIEESSQALSTKKPDLPPQLVPAGWFPPAEWLAPKRRDA